MEKREQVVKCPHCGNKTAQRVECSVQRTDSAKSTNSDGEWSVEVYEYFTQCKTCEEVSIYSDFEGSDNPGDLSDAWLIYPQKKELSGIPQAIQEIYNEAKSVEKISPTAFAILIRKSFEYICIDKKAQGKDLKQKIDDLAKKRIIPETLSRMANAIRYIGNLGAHSEKIKIDKEEATLMDDFFIAVVEYVYIAPNKLGILLERLKKK